MELASQLSILFGKDEEVKLRRQLVLIREKLMNHIYNKHHYIDCLCSGSLGEGVAYPSSDDDVMFCMLPFRVVTATSKVTQRGDLVMLPSEHSPMYCLLWDITRSHPLDKLQIIKEMPMVSSSLLKKWLMQISVSMIELKTGRRVMPGDCEIHGPCLSQKVGKFENDFAFSFPCPFWPDVASDWVSRRRLHEWPSNEMVRNIVSSGCLVVPIGDPDSPQYLHEWRISFSKAERMLMHSFNHYQFLTYNLLRLTLKRILQEEVPDILCSYFMKTTLFYTSENTSRQIWKLDNLESCYRNCLSVLFNFIKNRYCPNYFIQECNMIKRKVNHTNQQQLLDLIQYAHSIGIVGVVHLSGESICLDERWTLSIREMKEDRDFLFSLHLEKIFDRLVIMLELLEYEDRQTRSSFLSILLNILKAHSPLTKGTPTTIIFHRGLTYCCHQMMNYLWKSPCPNKQTRHLYRYIKTLLRFGYIHNGDVTTGKLTMATYMYIVGKTDQTLAVIERLLSEYPPYAMDNSLSDIKRTTYTEVICGKGYTIEYKAKRAFAPGYEIYRSFLHAFPFSLRIWIFIANRITLSPLSYAFLLQCLCYIKKKKNSLLFKSKRYLIGQLKDLTDEKEKANVRMCLGIINNVHGNNQSACRWLGSGYARQDYFDHPHNHEFSSAVLAYVACMLNRCFRPNSLCMKKIM